jgi:uncharacterized membrane protein YhaH (DUF805 family)
MAIGFGQAVGMCLLKYVTFPGRALFMLLYLIAGWVIILILAFIVGFGIASIVAILLYLAILLPGISVAVRRLHDVDKSGGWFFIQSIPIVGSHWFLYYTNPTER